MVFLINNNDIKVGGIGQLFFAYRIWMISSEKAPTFTIAFVSPSFLVLCSVHTTYSFILLLKIAFGSICAALFSASAFFHAKTFTVLLTGDNGFAAITVWFFLYTTLGLPY